ncbi:MAG: tripartite tricarboxylate transporter substrate binding protein [Variovorax sp.]|nr:tripartite tricarboxylate transporter substrate binding protein [Variovorax sp.]
MTRHTLPTTRRAFNAVLAASLLPLRALAEETFPARPVKFVNWSNPGGNLDLFGRILGDQAGRLWNQPVVTENKPGASGIIATDYVAKSPPDGYTVLITSSTGQLTNALTRLKLPFDPVRDFEPLSLLAAGNIALYARADAPFDNLKELVAYAKKADKPLSYGSFGPGTSAHLYGEAFAKQAGIALTHVPYKTGELGAMNDVIGGSLDLSFFSQGTAKVHGPAGKVKLLAISGPQRTKVLPDLPTFGEQGYEGFGMAGWIAAYAPARTPRAVIAKLAATMREALKQPEAAAKLEGLGYDLIGGTPEELRAFYQDEYKRFAQLVQVAGIKPE